MVRLQDAQNVYKNSKVAAKSSMVNGLLQESVLWKLLLLTALAYLIWGERISIIFNPADAQPNEQAAVPGQASVAKASLLEAVAPPPPPVVQAPARPEVEVVLPAGSLSNITFAVDPGYAERNGVEAKQVASRQAACRDYVGRFAPVAMAEMRKYGLPASIILAQGLLESNAGASPLARQSNNHFGVKCFSKRCKKGHCVNFSDDSHKDFFVKYENIWGSYRAHSEFLRQSDRYAKLFKLDPQDYRGWARGLQKAGYATDKKYGDKLIALIQNLELDQYDR